MTDPTYADPGERPGPGGVAARALGSSHACLRSAEATSGDRHQQTLAQATAQSYALISIAASLDRIADAMEAAAERGPR